MRVFEVYDNEQCKWIEIDIKSLKKGDLFRIFDDGIRYVNKEDGRTTWTVIGNHYLRNKEGYLFLECD